MADQKTIREAAEKLTADLIDKGLIIEGGWVGFKLAVFPQGGLSKIQHDEMRKAFFAGSLHLFTSILNVLEDGTDATEVDLQRMSIIHEELERFEKELLGQIPMEGSA